MSVESFCDVMGLVRKAPRTVPEIVSVTSLTANTVRGYLRALVDHGHVGLAIPRPNVRGKTTPVYCWLDEIYGNSKAGDSEK